MVMERLLSGKLSENDEEKEFIRDVSSYMTPQQIAKSMILKKNFNKEFKNQIKKHKNKDKINKRNQKQK